MARRLRLHHRIVIPFAVVAFVAVSATAYVALAVTSRALESRVEAQVLSTAALVGQSEFALNPTILRSVKAISGADVITYGPGGRVLASTVDPSRAGAYSSVAAGAAEALRASGEGPRIRHLACDGPCDVAYTRLPARPDAVVAVVASTSELVAATRALTRTIVAATVLSVVVMVLVSQVIARGVTAPIDQLVGFTHLVAGGDVKRRAADGDDEVGRLGAAFNDMLDRLKRSQHALVRSEKLALAGLFAARVAHDIRNPLSSIKMQTQLLHARVKDDPDRAMTSAMLRDIAQVESVIRDLLELARPGELKRRPTSLNAVVHDVLQQVAPQFAHRKITVETQFDVALPSLPLDLERFKQALLNVVHNAADAMPTGGTLRVVTRLASGGSTIELDVCDDGVGVDPAILDRVFDPFVSTKPEGVGLGLVNAKAVVESHGGTIALSPRAPRGTRATMALPTAHDAHG
jgi:signal transduction histidine kinase